MRSTPHLPTELWVKIIELRIDDCFRQPLGGKREAQLKELMAARQVSTTFAITIHNGLCAKRDFREIEYRKWTPYKRKYIETNLAGFSCTLYKGLRHSIRVMVERIANELLKFHGTVAEADARRRQFEDDLSIAFTELHLDVISFYLITRTTMEDYNDLPEWCWMFYEIDFMAYPREHRALEAAAAVGDIKVVKLLTSLGHLVYDISNPRLFHSPFIAAATTGKDNVLKFFVTQIPIDRKSFNLIDRTLQVAVHHQRAACVGVLLRFLCTHWDLKKLWIGSILRQIIVVGHVNTLKNVQSMLPRDFSEAMKKTYIVKAFQKACRLDRVDMVDYLIGNKLIYYDPESWDKSSPLWVAIDRYQIRMMTILIKYGTRIDKPGLVAHILSFKRIRYSRIPYLLDEGAVAGEAEVDFIRNQLLPLINLRQYDPYNNRLLHRYRNNPEGVACVEAVIAVMKKIMDTMLLSEIGDTLHIQRFMAFVGQRGKIGKYPLGFTPLPFRKMAEDLSVWLSHEE